MQPTTRKAKPARRIQSDSDSDVQIQSPPKPIIPAVNRDAVQKHTDSSSSKSESVETVEANVNEERVVVNVQQLQQSSAEQSLQDANLQQQHTDVSAPSSGNVAMTGSEPPVTSSTATHVKQVDENAELLLSDAVQTPHARNRSKPHQDAKRHDNHHSSGEAAISQQVRLILSQLQLAEPI